MLALSKQNSRRHKAVACYTVRRAIKDLKKVGLIETKQRYREQGGKSSLLFQISK